MEEAEGLISGSAGAEATKASSVDPIAVGLALAGASREKADAFLDDQRAFLHNQSSLIDVQKHHLHEQFKHLHLSVWEKQLGVLLRAATVMVGIVFFAAVAVMVWDAAHSNGLIVEPFAVSAEMAAKGLSGQVVASQVLDKLTAMQDATQSYRAPQSYANNWGNDLKVEIPETGVSLGEVRRFLRDWLGHDTHISGELWRTDSGIAVSARTSGDTGATFTGPQSDFDALVQKAAEHVYAQTQPYRYANYMRGRGRLDEAHAVYLRLTESGSALERGWAWYGIGVLSNFSRGDLRAAVWAYRRSIAIYPDLNIAYSALGGAENWLGHNEAMLEVDRRGEELLGRNSMPDIAARSRDYVRLQWTVPIPMLQGDFAEVVRRSRTGAEMPDQQGFRGYFRSYLARALANQHDGTARAALLELPSARTALQSMWKLTTPILVNAALENWQGVAQYEASGEQTLSGLANRLDVPVILGTQLRPWGALAKARLGDVAGAQRLIETTLDDCYDCARVRAQIAAMAGNPAQADAWFARAINLAPSIPFAYADWGQALLERGQADAAIEKFKLANQKGPHFADPLEGWGEALMAKNQSHLALAKFAEAEKYAPNWGRLHLKWGEALVYAGKKDEANVQFARAALDLTPSEKSELQKYSANRI